MVRHALGDNEKYSFTVLSDDLGTGPVNPFNIDERTDYFSRLYRHDKEYMEYVREKKSLLERFRSDVLACDKKILWLSKRSVCEYCGFLQFLSEQDDLRDIEIVDLTEGTENETAGTCGGAPYRMIQLSISEFSPETIIEAVKTARSPSTEETEYYLAVWKRLVEENANLRKLWRGQVYSAPDDEYDEIILSRISDIRVSAARIVGEVLGKLNDEYDQVGYAYIYSRLIHLIDSGIIEEEGSRDSMEFLEVKRVS